MQIVGGSIGVGGGFEPIADLKLDPSLLGLDDMDDDPSMEDVAAATARVRIFLCCFRSSVH